MAEFKITEFIHLGIDVGVEQTEWIIALDSEYKNVITHGTAQGYDPFVFNDNMRIEEIDGDSVMEYNRDKHISVDHHGNDREPIHYNRYGLYWNGDSKIWVKVRAFMNGKETPWFEKTWEPHHVDKDGEPIAPTNPLDLDDLEKYRRHTNRSY